MSGKSSKTAAGAAGSTLPLLIANLWHGVSGFAIFVVAARVLQEGEFGRLSLAMAIALAVEEFVKQGVPKAVAHRVAQASRDGIESDEARGGVATAIAAGLRLNFSYALRGAAFVALLAFPLGWAFDDSTMTLLLALGGLDLIVFAPYTIWLAGLNGLHRFRTQAALMITYSTLKAIVLISLCVWGETAMFGVAGYLVGSSVGSLVAWAVWRRIGPRDVAAPDDRERPTGTVTRSLAAMGAPLAFFGVMMAIFLNVDFATFRIGLTHAGWTIAGSHFLDEYSACVHISRMVFFVFLAFGDALFPSISRVLMHEARSVGAEKVRKSLGLLLLVLAPSIALGIATGQQTLWLIFENSYPAAGRDFLHWLLLLAGALTLASTIGSAVAASGRVWHLFRAMAVGLVLNIGANLAFGTASPSAPAVIALLSAGAIGVMLLPSLIAAFGARCLPWAVLPGVAIACAISYFGGAAIAGPSETWAVPYALFPVGGLVLGVAIIAGLAATSVIKKLAPRSPEHA